MRPSQSMLRTLVTLVLSGAAALSIPGAAPAQRMVRFTGSATNAKTGVDPGVRIDLLRWSTEDERAAAAAALTESGEEGLSEWIASAETVGYVWTSESAGYSVRYAQQIVEPGGAKRVVVVTEKQVGTRNPLIWNPIGPPEAPEAPLTLIELRLGGATSGEGRASFGVGIIADAAAGVLRLDGYETAPVLLEGVSEEAG